MNIYPIPIENYRGCAIFETSINPGCANKSRCVFAVISWGAEIVKTETIRYCVADQTARDRAIEKVKFRIDLKLKEMYS